MRSTEAIYREITSVIQTPFEDYVTWRYALAKLWSEMFEAGHAERAPLWATLAAQLLANDCELAARREERSTDA